MFILHINSKQVLINVVVTQECHKKCLFIECAVDSHYCPATQCTKELEELLTAATNNNNNLGMKELHCEA